jgi:hypothetical protein
VREQDICIFYQTNIKRWVSVLKVYIFLDWEIKMLGMLKTGGTGCRRDPDRNFVYLKNFFGVE